MRHIALCLALLVAGCTLDEIADGEELSTTEQSAVVIGSYYSQVMAKKPLGYWRLGEPRSSTTMIDSSAWATNGWYEHDYALGNVSAIAKDSNTSALFPAYPASYDRKSSRGIVSDQRRLSLEQDADFYNRPGSTSTAVTWGTAPDGEAWTCDSECSSTWYGRGPSGAFISPTPWGTTYQQTRPTTLENGEMQIRLRWTAHPTDGPLAPVALVARYVDSGNYVAAQLVEDATTHELRLQLIEMFNGVIYVRDTVGVGSYDVGVWWLVRFRFDGTQLKARAWNEGLTQPTVWQAQSTIGASSIGRVAIRSSNQFTSTRPHVYFTDFWVQQPGYTASMFIWAEGTQHASKVFPFGKSHHEDAWFADNHEWYWRFETAARKLKPYIFNPDGGYGAGVDLTEDVGYLSAGRWHHAVMTLDNGDWRDHTASIEGFLDGRHVGAWDHSGRRYNAISSCATPCSDGHCTDKNGVTGLCWAITPRNRNQSLYVGAVGNDDAIGFNGRMDEVAIFDRVLTPTDVANLYDSSCQPSANSPLAGMTASASSTEGGSPSLAPSMAVDLNPSTRWSSNYSDNQQLTVDMGKTRAVQKVMISWETAYAATYDLQVSDNGIVFTTIRRVNKTSASSDVIDVYRSTRYIRMLGVTRATGWGYSIWELSVMPCETAAIP